MLKIISFIAKLHFVILYYLSVFVFICFILPITSLFMGKYKESVRNLFSGNFIEPDQTDLDDLKSGEEYYIIKTPLHLLFDIKTKIIK